MRYPGTGPLSGEGGGVFCKDSELYQKLFYHHNFGHEGQEAFQGLGINAKMSELQAALGLAVLPYMPQIVGHRKKAVTFYQEHLSQYTTLKLREGTQWNYAYYPIIFDSEALLLTAQERLNALDIYPRRYFYPSLHTLPYVSGPDMPVSQSVSERILCLPLSHDISEEIQAQIVNTLTA